MKKINIPKSITVSVCFFEEAESSINVDSDVSNDLDTIDKNGSEIIAAVIMIEDRMIEAVSKILFGKSKELSFSSDFFINEIMETSNFSYSFKRQVFTRLLEQKSLLPKADIAKLKAGLNKLMLWRNAFAHGKVIIKQRGGFLLQYYSGGKKELSLDDSFFEVVEDTIRSCLYSCNGVIKGIEECDG